MIFSLDLKIRPYIQSMQHGWPIRVTDSIAERGAVVATVDDPVAMWCLPAEYSIQGRLLSPSVD